MALVSFSITQLEEPPIEGGACRGRSLTGYAEWVSEPIPTRPRKSPKQERSKATVEAILGATARVLVREGYEGATTSRIAEVSGYGVGSLYDYFPNKESLVVALIERHAEEMVEVAEATFRAHEDSALNVAVRAWVEAGVRAHLASPELHKVLVEQVPKVGGPGPHRRFRGSHRSSRACLPGTPRRGGPSAGPAADRVRRCAGAGVAHAQGGR